MGLIAFRGNQDVKDFYIKRVHGHFLADEIIKGQYWEDGKGCGVGCTIHGDDHKKYEVKLGIPEWLARVEDIIFEGLPDKRSKSWPEEFLSSINIGSDLSKVEAPFIIFVLESLFDNFDHKKFPDVKSAIDTCIDLYKIGDLNPSKAWSAAESAGNAARSAAWSAAESAGNDAWSAWNAARSDARSAAESAGNAARSAARSAWGARSAARSAAESAACSAWGVWGACSAAYEKFANKLLELLRECK